MTSSLLVSGTDARRAFKSKQLVIPGSLRSLRATRRHWNVEMRALKIAGATIAVVIVITALPLMVGIPSGFITSTIQERIDSIMKQLFGR
jgi:hypothetical protein